MNHQQDVLSEIVALLHPHTVLGRVISGRGAWGVQFDGYKSPLYGRNSPSFCIILSGQCWLSREEAEPILLKRGDFLLFRHSLPLKLSGDLDAPCVPGSVSETDIRYGDQDGEPDMEMLGGAFSVDPSNTELLLKFLPDKLHIRSIEHGTTDLAFIINLIIKECTEKKPGRDMVLARLMDVMLVKSLRWYGEQAAQSGLLAGLRHPPIALTLRAMHSNVRQDWTVAMLARHAGMSRSSYAKRFGDTVGCGPMEYLARWRISLAQDALTRTSDPLETIAQKVGYRSAAALSNAFNRITGMSPSAFRRLSHKNQAGLTEAGGAFEG
jgi:AraC-like DNA-binding protein